jgi:hypothetical protein
LAECSIDDLSYVASWATVRLRQVDFSVLTPSPGKAEPCLRATFSLHRFPIAGVSASWGACLATTRRGAPDGGRTGCLRSYVHTLYSLTFLYVGVAVQFTSAMESPCREISLLRIAWIFS